MGKERIVKAASVWVVFMCLVGFGMAQDPFQVDAQLSDDGKNIDVLFSIPEEHYLYVDQIEVFINNASNAAKAVQFTEPKHKMDKLLGEEVDVYLHTASLSYVLPENVEWPVSVAVNYQGCSESVCFLPAERIFTFDKANPSVKTVTDRNQPDAISPDDKAMVPGFVLGGSATGYMREEPFVSFLKAAVEGRVVNKSLLGRGVLVMLVTILLGGLALNLTPCVLPMIPINLAIIGAGTGSGSRGKGMLLGGMYGLGIAIAYGGLGLAVVLAGAPFGQATSSPWFSIGVAVLFALMALAMFGAFNIDFSALQGKIKVGSSGKGNLFLSFGLGAVAALLAGACVAPVLISVLLLSADLSKTGNPLGLALPFILGIGMALPWPFAGAGMAILPKPGAWMERIKYAFGVIILLGAIYYGHKGISSLNPDINIDESWYTSLEQGVQAARDERKPVFIDFWRINCTSCVKMEKTTFKSQLVKDRLEDFVKIKYQAEDLKDPDIKADLKRFGVLGFPSYVVLVPLPGQEDSPDGSN